MKENLTRHSGNALDSSETFMTLIRMHRGLKEKLAREKFRIKNKIAGDIEVKFDDLEYRDYFQVAFSIGKKKILALKGDG